MTEQHRRSDLHLPVMVAEVLRYLITKPDGVYVDLTVGSGGHLEAIAKTVSAEARLYGLEIDETAAQRARERLAPFANVKEVRTASYVEVLNWMRDEAQEGVDGILLDLGLSSLQLDHPDRGFMFRDDGPLDMRFDPASGRPTAADLIAGRSEKELADLFWQLGEERQARKIANVIVKERRNEMIRTTRQLAAIVERSVHPTQKIKSLARVFQALRIAVNEELDRIALVLPNALAALAPGGRLVVISYHSLEDRLVKRFFQSTAKEGCALAPPNGASEIRYLDILTKKVVPPTEAEISQNSRARSAKLRAAQRRIG